MGGKIEHSGWVLAFVTLILLSGCWGSGTADSESAKTQAFEEVIGFGPDGGVADIRSHYYYMRDNYIRWLRFRCDAATIERIVKSSEFHESSGGNRRWTPGFEDRSQNPNAQDWWWETGEDTVFQEFEREVSKEHTSDIAHLWIDRRSLTVFATRDVID
jgi:hypothetical protein